MLDAMRCLPPYFRYIYAKRFSFYVSFLFFVFRVFVAAFATRANFLSSVFAPHREVFSSGPVAITKVHFRSVCSRGAPSFSLSFFLTTSYVGSTTSHPPTLYVGIFEVKSVAIYLCMCLVCVCSWWKELCSHFLLNDPCSKIK